MLGSAQKGVGVAEKHVDQVEPFRCCRLVRGVTFDSGCGSVLLRTRRLIAVPAGPQGSKTPTHLVGQTRDRVAFGIQTDPAQRRTPERA